MKTIRNSAVALMLAVLAFEVWAQAAATAAAGSQDLKLGQSLKQFLMNLPSSPEAQLLSGMVISGTLGICIHYFMKYLNDEPLFKGRWKSVLASWFTFIGWSAGCVSAGMFVTDNGDFVGWMNVLSFGLTSGLGIDAVANKGFKPTRMAWSPEERAAKTAAGTEVSSQPDKVS